MLIVASVLWLWFDPLGAQCVDSLISGIKSQEPLEAFGRATERYGWKRVLVPVLTATLVLLLVFTEVAFYFMRRGSRRSTRDVLVMMGVVCVWCGISVSYHSLAWHGERYRSIGRTNALDRLAEQLNAEWPRGDGEIAGIGPFTAYPFGKPQVLLLLTPYPLEGTETVVSAIERSPDGVLRFQMGGIDGGDWIEWHGSGTLPTAFTGGLSDEHAIKQYVHLRGDWYLVRYSTPGPAE